MTFTARDQQALDDKFAIIRMQLSAERRSSFEAMDRASERRRDAAAKKVLAQVAAIRRQESGRAGK